MQLPLRRLCRRTVAAQTLLATPGARGGTRSSARPAPRRPPCSARHVRQLRNAVGKAREILGSDGRYTTTAERILADDELADAIARADLILIALNGGCP